MQEQEWIYLKDEKPPQGVWVRCRGWHELTARHDSESDSWEQDEDAPQYGRLVQWRLVTREEISQQKSVCDDE